MKDQFIQFSHHKGNRFLFELAAVFVLFFQNGSRAGAKRAVVEEDGLLVKDPVPGIG